MQVGWVFGFLLGVLELLERNGYAESVQICPQCLGIFSLEATGFCSLDGTKLTTYDRDPWVGRGVGRYRVEERVASGAMGVVYRATHMALGRYFAIKILFGEMCSDRRMTERFRREAAILSKMDHWNVVGIADFSTTKHGIHYIVMDWIDGVSLRKLMGHQSPMALFRIAEIVRQIAEGLGALHDAGIVHRDLKPSNIMVAESGGTEIVKIVDLGIAAFVDRAMEADRLTTVRGTVGTPRYMAPEQFVSSVVGPSADLYALGVILYELLTGGPPFELSNAPLPQRPNASPSVPPGPLGSLAVRLLAAYPADRPKTAYAVADEISWLFASGDRLELDGGASSVDPAPALRTERRVERWPETLPDTHALEPAQGQGAGASKEVALSRRLGLGAFVVAALVGIAAMNTDVFLSPKKPVDLRGLSARSGPGSQGGHRKVKAKTLATPSGVSVPDPVAPTRTIPQPQAKKLRKPDVVNRKPPKRRSQRRRVKKQTLAVGKVTVGAHPYAVVVIDGQEKGITPLERLTLPAGFHTVELLDPVTRKVRRLERVMVPAGGHAKVKHQGR